MKKRGSKLPGRQQLDRRSFLKVLATGTFSSLLPPGLSSLQHETESWPTTPRTSLPGPIQAILKLVPKTQLGENGLLSVTPQNGGSPAQVPLAPTNWNIENSHSYNRLLPGQPWGIVLHWFGDRNGRQGDLDFYLRGFNGVRQIGEYMTSTSAHFLVGDHPPLGVETNTLGIAQLQEPAPDGTPYQAAHIRTLDFGAYTEGRHYFVMALHQLSQAYPGVRTLLQDFYAVPGVPAHMRTLAVEITGFDFDTPIHYPGPQKIANVLSVVRACMQRYQIPALNLMGHFELQLSKPDPGKKFLALIKFLIGILALVELEQDFKALVFGPFLPATGSREAAVEAYFRYLRDYLNLTTSPRQIYEWDAWSKFLVTYDILTNGRAKPNGCHTFFAPLDPPTWRQGYTFLNPENHDGIDIYPGPQTTRGNDQERQVHLLATGTCIHLGISTGMHDGFLAVFRHRQADGSEIITAYGHLDEFTDLQIGHEYPGGWVIGSINTPKSAPRGYLHFSVAYGPAWETNLHLNPNTPLNAGPTWIRKHFMDPTGFLPSTTPPGGKGLKNAHIQWK
jgi:hypothetical protein